MSAIDCSGEMGPSLAERDPQVVDNRKVQYFRREESDHRRADRHDHSPGGAVDRRVRIYGTNHRL